MTKHHQESPAFELGALEKEGGLWGFRFSGAHAAMRFLYPKEEAARRARMLMFEALKGVADPAKTARNAARAVPDALPPRKLRHWVHTLLEEGALDSLPGRLIEGFLVALIVANVVAVALETIPAIDTQFRAALLFFERASLLVFSLEYVLRVWSCIDDPRVAVKGAVKGRVLFALRPLMIVDFLAFAPSVLGLFFGFDLRVLRVFRLFRLLKLARYSQALQALLNVLYVERSALLASAILLLAFTCLTGEMMHLAEGDIQPKTLGTMPGAMYWALTTLTTVGYGDVSPITPLGKFIAGITMIAGLALFSLPVGIIANGFVTGLSRRRFAITWNMLRRQPLFQDMEIESLTDIVEIPTAAIIREHAHLTVEGKEAEEFYVIVSGIARAELLDRESDLGPGDIIGAEALHHLAKYTRTVTAETDMRVMAFPAEELRRLCRKYPVLRHRVEMVLEKDGGRTTTAANRTEALEKEVRDLQKAIAAMMLEKHAS